MLDQIAFQTGVFFTLATLIFTFTMWFLAAVNRLRIESVGVMHAPYTKIYEIELKAVQLILGWLPLGSFIKIAGMVDKTLDPNSNTVKDIPLYEFRSRSLGTKVLVIMTSPILLIFIGLILLNITTFPLLELLYIYLQITFFQLPLEAGTPLWNAFYTNPTFLIGTIFLFLGLGNIGTNLGSLLDQEYQNLTWLLLLLPLSFFFLGIGILRLIWFNFTWINLLYFLLGSLLTGVIGFLFAILLAKLLPNT